MRDGAGASMPATALNRCGRAKPSRSRHERMTCSHTEGAGGWRPDARRRRSLINTGARGVRGFDHTCAFSGVKGCAPVSDTYIVAPKA